jgi:hypothetical protein
MRISKAEALRRRETLPYGAYIGEDGTETLFDRFYQPMVARDKDGSNVRKASGWIPHVKQIWFYDDSCSPHRIDKPNKKAFERCFFALQAFNAGLTINEFIYSES